MCRIDTAWSMSSTRRTEQKVCRAKGRTSAGILAGNQKHAWIGFEVGPEFTFPQQAAVSEAATNSERPAACVASVECKRQPFRNGQNVGHRGRFSLAKLDHASFERCLTQLSETRTCRLGNMGHAPIWALLRAAVALAALSALCACRTAHAVPHESSRGQTDVLQQLQCNLPDEAAVSPPVVEANSGGKAGEIEQEPAAAARPDEDDGQPVPVPGAFNFSAAMLATSEEDVPADGVSSGFYVLLRNLVTTAFHEMQMKSPGSMRDHLSSAGPATTAMADILQPDEIPEGSWVLLLHARFRVVSAVSPCPPPTACMEQRFCARFLRGSAGVGKAPVPHAAFVAAAVRACDE